MFKAKVSTPLAQRQERVIRMIREHRRIQQRVMDAYRKREVQLLEKIKAEMLREEEDDDKPQFVHG